MSVQYPARLLSPATSIASASTPLVTNSATERNGRALAAMLADNAVANAWIASSGKWRTPRALALYSPH